MVNTTLKDHLFQANELFITQSRGQTNPASRLDQLAILSDISLIIDSCRANDLDEAWTTIAVKRKWTTRERYVFVDALHMIVILY